MREISFTCNYLKYPPGSCLAQFGNTKVICTCTIEEGTPPFVKQGAWLSAEYSMLPGSVSSGRKRRDGAKKDGRSVEIQRLIGRALRAALRLENMPEVSITVDCDVIQADGGTRTASISGGWLALIDALKFLAKQSNVAKIEDSCEHFPVHPEIPSTWLNGRVTAVSAGIVHGEIVCDLDYEADSQADVDMNIIALNDAYVEIQGGGEKGLFDRQQLEQLLDCATDGLQKIAEAQDTALKQSN